MKKYTVVYDRTATYWMKDDQYNHMFIKEQEGYFTSLLNNRGYIYLNQICEYLGVGWKPRSDNPCFVSDEHRRIDLIMLPRDDCEYEIIIQVV